MKNCFRIMGLFLLLIVAISLTPLAAESTSYSAEDMSGLATTTDWFSSSWWNGGTRRNRLRTTRGRTTTSNTAWSSINYHVNRTSSAFNVSFSRSMTRSGSVSLGTSVTSGAIRGNMSTAVGFSRTQTVGASSIRVPANRRVTMQTRTSVHTTTFTTRVQLQCQGLFQRNQWTNCAPVSPARASSFTERVPGFRAFETAANTVAPR